MMHFQLKSSNTTVVMVNSSNDMTWLRHIPKTEKCYNPYFAPKHKNRGSMHSQWEYAWQNLWHTISRQPW